MWYKLKRILIYPDGVTEKQVYPSTKWKPWVNTLAYYPLETDTNDYSGNNRNWTNSNVTFSNWVAYFNGSNAMVTIGHDTRNQTKTNMTIQAWFKLDNDISSSNLYSIVTKWQNAASNYLNFSYLTTYSPWTFMWGFSTWGNYSNYPWSVSQTLTTGVWHLVTLTNENWNSQKLYIDKILIGSSTVTTNSPTINIPLIIWNSYYRTVNTYFKWNIAKVILEDKTWSLADISDYYDNNMPS